MSKSTYYRHKILFGGDWSDSSTEIDEIFDVNHDSDGKDHSGDDNVEVGSLSLDVSESPTELPTILEEGNAESTQAPESVRK